MAEMGVAALAETFGALHAMAGVRRSGDIGGVKRAGEAWPAAAGIEFVSRVEQRSAAADATVYALVVAVPIFACEGCFGAFFLRHMVLPWRKLCAPFGFRLEDFRYHADAIFVAGSVQMPRYR